MEFPPSLPPHPRLFVPGSGFSTLKRQVHSDAPSRRIAECLRRKSEQFIKLPPNKRVMEGRRLLGVSRSCLGRIQVLAMAARLDDEPRFARRAIEEMLAAATFTDWNPSHFLDVAEMTLALAIGYDWLYEQLAPNERDTVASAIIEKGLKPSFADPPHGWVSATHNWNQVCHGGMTTGALAVAEHEPVLGKKIVERALENVPRVNVAYTPDGAYAEGPMYWNYGTSYQVVLISALESVLGSDFGLADGPGFLESAHYIRQMDGPTGLVFNYSDCRPESGSCLAMLWFSRRLHEPALAVEELRRLDKHLTHYEHDERADSHQFLAIALTWHAPLHGRDETPAPSLPLSWRGMGINPVAVHRTSWEDPLATFVGIKAGSPSVNHGHMDVGSFVLEAGGVRWASDLGMQGYEKLEAAGVQLWNGKQNGARWTVFRLGSQGHGVPSFNGAQQVVDGHADIVRYCGDDHAAMRHAVVDLSGIYSDHVPRYWRGIGLLTDGRVLLQDEWTAGDQAMDLRWQMLTFSTVAVDEKQRCFVLKQNGKQLVLRLLQDAGNSADIKLSVEDKFAPANRYDAPNPGLKLIVLHVGTQPHEKGRVRLVATLADSPDDAVPPLCALAEW